MNKTMHVEKLDVGSANRLLLDSFKARDDVKLKIGNSIWADPAKITLNQKFAEATGAEFDAEIRAISFGDPATKETINNWVSERTEKKIPELLKELDAATVCMLVNAIYFKGDWTLAFDKDETGPADFTLADGKTKTVQMMHSSKAKFRYAETDDVQVVALPYGAAKADPDMPGPAPKVNMWLAVPREGKTLDALIKDLTPAGIKGWQTAARSTEGTVALPRFKLKYRQELQDDLPEMGMASAFKADTADFSGFEDSGNRGKLFISKVVHEAVIEVNEEGTEAAAASSVDMQRGGKPRTFSVTCDRPFLLVISDDRTGSILFMGAIHNPESK
jgi:serpin B